MKVKKLAIVYEDKYFIIVNKEAHVLSISNSYEKENTLYYQVSAYVKRANKHNKVFIIHRLDKETSGLVIFAKSMEAKKLMQDNWEEVKRSYLGVVHGKVIYQNKMISSYLRETSTHYVYSARSGKYAETTLTTLRSNSHYSLLDINIKTGRHHQIRVHLNDLKHPLVGEKTYTSFKDKENRLYLHAYYLEFAHPFTKEVMQIKLPIPPEFQKFFKEG